MSFRRSVIHQKGLAILLFYFGSSTGFWYSRRMTKNAVIPIERIAEKIYLIRDEKVMLDSDLAELY